MDNDNLRFVTNKTTFFLSKYAQRYKNICKFAKNVVLLYTIYENC